ncbi:hypothetical protein B0J18DRAFT_489389 [Chaetomium sp. MPI-SDFR-AT-0129]|nr:hypothetical protein B0J18DRAFT_489389 [Chaetomium sp. MPI-SDFR-AT-0129]
MNTRRPAAGAGAGVRTVQKGQAYAHLASPRQAQTRGNLTSPRQAQTRGNLTSPRQARKYAHLASPRQAETSTTRTTRRVVAGQNGQPMEVLETEQRTTKRTMWTRVFSGGDKTATKKPSQPGKYKFWQRTGNKNTNTHASKTGTNSAGFNLRYYRERFAELPRQTQFDLYMAGMAPLMTYLEHRRFKSRNAGMRVLKAYRPVPVMYAAQEAPSGFAAPPKNLRLEAKIAKERDAARAVRRNGKATSAAAAAASASVATAAATATHNSTSTAAAGTTVGATGANAAAKRRKVVKKKEEQEDTDEDALPAFPTPVMYQQEMKRQTRKNFYERDNEQGNTKAPTQRPTAPPQPPQPPQPPNVNVNNNCSNANNNCSNANLYNNNNHAHSNARATPPTPNP